MREAFKGITVLEVGTMTPGKYTGFLLAGWGAAAIRVERPGMPDSVSTEDLALNRGKRSIALNLRADAGREVLLRLAERAEVLMESYRPGVVGRLGIDYDEVRQRNAGIVYCSLSGFGQDGPDRLRPAFDLAFLAESGLAHLLSQGDATPTPPRTYLADAVSGLMAAFAIAAALRQREATGRGTHIDLSMLESAFSLLAASHGTIGDNGRSAGAETEPWSRRPAYDIYEAGDGRHIAISAARPASCQALFEHLGRPELAAKGLRPAPEGQEAADFLKSAFAAKPAAAWIESLSALDIEIARVNTPDEAFALPQLTARGLVVESVHPQAGELLQIGLPAGGEAGAPAPAIGADTDAILAELGYDDVTIAALRTEGAI
ncbi:MAG: CaiB/BaiF CoA-transferase family protein [Alphaproteobacteria bacterium]|jgi:crotonobetainyl-CoA:carnitine CoA-transferase CaiB-like acyl-CoA transferase|nr:CaiB/BaiF CoA-transferase family protein [Alphaproteobacteria bacterium]